MSKQLQRSLPPYKRFLLYDERCQDILSGCSSDARTQGHMIGLKHYAELMQWIVHHMKACS